MATLSYDQQMQVQASARVYQQRYDDALSAWGMRTPSPVLGEDIAEYRCKLAILAKRQLPEDHELRKITYRRLGTDVFNNFEPQLLSEVQRAAYDPSTVPVGQFRRVVEVAPDGLRTVRFVGQESFVKDLGRPGRRVVSFLTPTGRLNGSGIPIR